MNFRMDLLKARTTRECVDLAIVDAYGEDEQATGWLTCIEEVFSGVKTVRVLDQEVVLKGFDIEDGITIVAICKLGKKSARVALESVEWNNLSKAQKLWLKAWRAWRPK